jgi:hypothetical protein
MQYSPPFQPDEYIYANSNQVYYPRDHQAFSLESQLNAALAQSNSLNARLNQLS